MTKVHVMYLISYMSKFEISRSIHLQLQDKSAENIKICLLCRMNNAIVLFTQYSIYFNIKAPAEEPQCFDCI